MTVNNNIAGHMTRISVAVTTMPQSISLDFKFLFTLFRSMEVATIMIYVGLVGYQLPDDFLKHAKILLSGVKFSVLVSAPCKMFEEGLIRAQMGQ